MTETTQPPTDTDPARWRLTVRPDETADGPIQWGHLTVVPVSVVTGGHLDETPEGGTDPIGLRRALSRMSGAEWPYGGVHLRDGQPSTRDTDQVLEAAIRWARVFHGVTVQRWRPQGYSQSAWGDALSYLETDDARAGTLAEQDAELAGWLADADRWYRGDVYRVTLEHAITWHRDELHDGDPDETMTTWETVDSLWGCYLVTYGPDTYTAADVARENFDVPAGLDLDAVAVIEP